MATIVCWMLQSYTCSRTEKRRLLWFTVVGSSDETNYMLMLQAALESGLQCCSDNIYPVVLLGQYDIPRWMTLLNRSSEVLVLNHNTSFAPRIARRAKNKLLSKHGTYLRLDIPVVIGNAARIISKYGIRVRTDYVLYTDCDVILRNIDRIYTPKILAMGPEVLKGGMVNSGVMFINVTGFNEARGALIDYADKKRWEFGWMDQRLINKFFGDTREPLPDEYNWKPYWGVNKDANVLHFHGPKINRCVDCLMKHRFLPDVNYTTICSCPPYNKALALSRSHNSISFDRQMQSYAYYMGVFYNHLHDFGERMSKLGLYP